MENSSSSPQKFQCTPSYSALLPGHGRQWSVLSQVSQKRSHIVQSLWVWLLALGRKHGAHSGSGRQLLLLSSVHGVTAPRLLSPGLSWGTSGFVSRFWIMKKAAVNVRVQALCRRKFSFLLIESLGEGSLVPTVSTHWLCKTLPASLPRSCERGRSLRPHQLAVVGISILAKTTGSCTAVLIGISPVTSGVKHLSFICHPYIVFDEVSVQIFHFFEVGFSYCFESFSSHLDARPSSSMWVESIFLQFVHSLNSVFTAWVTNLDEGQFISLCFYRWCF